MVEELFGEPGVRPLVFGDHQQPRGVLVDAVHQSGPHIALLEQGQILQMVCKGVHERCGVVAVTGMDDHARRLVDQQQVVVLVGNFERDVFGNDLDFALGIGHHQRDAVAGFDLVARLRGFAVDQDIACVGSRLDAVARTTLHVDRQELVQPQRALPRSAVML